jgi:hypothetical protein
LAAATSKASKATIPSTSAAEHQQQQLKPKQLQKEQQQQQNFSIHHIHYGLTDKQP